MLSGLLKLLFFTLLFAPKVNIIGIPGFSVSAKVEDIVWGGLALLALIVCKNRLRVFPSAVFSALLLYLVISCMYFPGNLLLVIRLFFYALPILLLVSKPSSVLDFVSASTKAYALIFSILSTLQVSMPFFMVHTGEILFTQGDRAPGIFGNGVEFALMALMLMWLLRIIGRLSPLNYLMFLLIAFNSGSRLAFLLVVLSGIYFVAKERLGAVNFLYGLVTAVFSVFIYSVASFEDSRLFSIDILEVFSSAASLVSVMEGRTLGDGQMGGYCFSFDDSLSEDQSFAMRLAKAKFVIEYVILGGHPFGLGLGNCIGDAGDNLFVRSLSDGGIPYFVLILFFFISLFAIKPEKGSPLDLRVFIGVFICASVFYDTLYFSRVAPIFFLVLFFSLGDRMPANTDRSKKYVMGSKYG